MTNWNEQVANGAILLTVNQRLARHHQTAFQQWQTSNDNTWWVSPKILPVNSWLAAVYADALADGIATRALVPDVLSLRAWKLAVEQDAAAALLDVQSAAHLARQSWQLSCSWRCQNDQDRYLSFDQFCWQRWLKRYQDWLDAENFIDDALLPDEIASLIELPQMRARLPDKIILAGFLQLSAQLAALFEAFRNVGIDVVHSERTADAFVHVHAFPDDESELTGIAAQMRAELQSNDQQSFGLVVPDLQARRGEVLRAYDRIFFPGQSPEQIRAIGRPYDLSLGLPLAEQVVVVNALNLLDLCHASIKSSDISSVLLSPYIKGANVESVQRQQLDRNLRDQRVSILTLRTLAKHLNPSSILIKPVTQLLDKIRLDETMLSVWAARFDQWLSKLGWPGKGFGSEEHQAVMVWRECLDDMQILDNGNSVNVYQAMQELRTLTRERIFQPQMISSAPIQIVGRLESHGVAFDALWVAGLDDEKWPPTSSPSPFLAIDAQKDCGIPGASSLARLELAEQEFGLWASQAPVLFVSYSINRDGKTLRAARIPDIAPSKRNRKLADERVLLLEAVHGSPIINPLHHIHASLCLEQLPDEYGPGLPTGSKAAGGARLFENQALCPFRAFALHRLSIRALEEPGLGLDARQHGTALHTALEKFWKLTQSHDALLQLTNQQLLERISDVVRDALEKLTISEELRALEQTRLNRLIHGWIEGQEKPRQPFEIHSLEKEHLIEHGGVQMKVILDRIDAVGHSLIVVDYKTGTNNKIGSWADDRIRNPQLPLYVLTDDAINAAAFAQVTDNQSKFLGVASEAELLPKVSTTVRKSRSNDATDRPLTQWFEWRAHWKSSLDNIALEIRQGLASVTPAKGACAYCEVKSLCRVDEHVLSSAEESVEQAQKSS